MEQSTDFTIPQIGECTIPSPMKDVRFTDDTEHVLLHSDMKEIKRYLELNIEPPHFETAGPRKMIYFDPATLNCGIVTCGGLCPGLNDVIRAVVLSLHHHYGVRNIYGFPYGYEGLVSKIGHQPIVLTPQLVSQVNELGGTMLGSSRGNQNVSDMVDTLEQMKIGILFTVGGDSKDN